MSQTTDFRSAVLRERHAAEDDFIEDMRSPLEERLFRGSVIGPFTLAGDRKTLQPQSRPVRLGKINVTTDASILVLTRAQLEGSINLLEQKTFRGADPLKQFRAKIGAYSADSIVLTAPYQASSAQGEALYIVGDYVNFSDMLLGGAIETAGEVIPSQCDTSPESLDDHQIDSDLFGDDRAIRSAAAAALDSRNDFLAIKGPPGTGKTWLLARVALVLAARGESVTLTGPSHAAVNNALREIAELRTALTPAYDNVSIAKASGSMQGLASTGVDNFGDLKGKDKRDAIDGCDILGLTLNSLAGTLKFRDDWQRDVLIVDEAGQMLMMQIAAATGHYQRALFFGDEAQLAPVKKASHRPDTGEGDSCIQYLIRQRGMDWVLPLETTHRLNDRICKVIRKNFYPDIDLQPGIHKHSRIDGSKYSKIPAHGVDFIDIPHEHACTRSDDEISAIYRLARALIEKGWLILAPDGDEPRPIVAADFAVLAPYRNQVSGLQQALAPLSIGHNQIGTVDKMQGQGRPIVIYSCTTSSADVLAEQAEFIYSPNRWNVLISRAMAQCYIVGAYEALQKPSAQTLTGLNCSARIVELLNGIPRYTRKLPRFLLPKSPEDLKPRPKQLKPDPSPEPTEPHRSGPDIPRKQLVEAIQAHEKLHKSITGKQAISDLHHCYKFRGKIGLPAQKIDIYINRPGKYMVFVCDPESDRPAVLLFHTNVNMNSKNPALIRNLDYAAASRWRKSSSSAADPADTVHTATSAPKAAAPTPTPPSPSPSESVATEPPATGDPSITIDPSTLDVEWLTGHDNHPITLKRSQWQRVCQWLESGKSDLKIKENGQVVIDGFVDSKALRFEGKYWRIHASKNLTVNILDQL